MFNRLSKIVIAGGLIAALSGCVIYQPAQYPKYQPGTNPGDPAAEYCPYHRQYNCPYNHARSDRNAINSLNRTLTHLIQLIENDRATALHTR